MSATWREALLREAARRFEEQQTEVLASAAASTADGVSPSTRIMAPISPSPPALIEEVISRLAAERVLDADDAASSPPLIGPGACIVDLGCGDGRWLLAAARAFRSLGLQCVGYDLDETLLYKARNEAAAFAAEGTDQPGAAADGGDRAGRISGSDKGGDGDSGGGSEGDGGSGGAAAVEINKATTVTVHRKDLMLADVSGAAVVVAYLFREGCVEVQEKLAKELPKSAAVVSVGFAMRGWEAQWSCRVDGSVPCYFYRQPWKAAASGEHPGSGAGVR